MYSLFTALCSHPTFALPYFAEPFQIESYISYATVGGAFTQKQEYVQKFIAFLRKNLTNSKKNYSVYIYELLAIVTSCKAWYCYIDG